MATFWELLLNFFFPLQCVICGRLLAADNKERICGDCWSRIIYLNRPIDIKLSLERIWSVAVYEGVLKELIHQFKYKERKYLASPLGKLLVDFVDEYLKEERFDYIVPIPLEKARQKKRGYNQAELLARVLGEAMNKPILTDLVERRKKTKPQFGLNREERFENLSGAFEISKTGEEDIPTIAGKKILLLDDLTTTGATLDECARALRTAGVSEIYALVLAHGM
ncbi:ComF family protein [bacterium]|nr:ComF family protein [bacterium]NIO18661.1 ComF family protein [bacterium]NIO73692.1 ComF family protein [bacterium]